MPEVWMERWVEVSKEEFLPLVGVDEGRWAEGPEKVRS